MNNSNLLCNLTASIMEFADTRCDKPIKCEWCMTFDMCARILSSLSSLVFEQCTTGADFCCRTLFSKQNHEESSIGEDLNRDR